MAWERLLLINSKVKIHIKTFENVSSIYYIKVYALSVMANAGAEGFCLLINLFVSTFPGRLTTNFK